MEIAKKIQKELDQKVELRQIKKIIAAYEKLNNGNEDEYMTAEETVLLLDYSLRDTTSADKIKAYRQRESLTQKELALKADIKQQHVSEIERGIRSVGVTTAKKLAKALNCNYKSFL